jgi:FtsP/CotA-like multicopper oxidase with cupredoxin domain
MTRREKEIWKAAKNRQELIAAGFSRRDLLRMGLLTGAGYLVTKSGLSARADGGSQPQSPPTQAFVEPLPIMAVKQPVTALTPAPTLSPNTAAGEARTRPHQVFTQLPPQKLYEVHDQAGLVSVSADLPLQTIWGYDGTTPGPTFHAKYGEPILVRHVNELPVENGGFGLNSIATHLHNGHTPSESDGFPTDFQDSGQFYDHHYPNALDGFSTDPALIGDPREANSTMWYHDHRVDFTAQNVYKGLAGFFLLFNDQDTGDETTGFRLPSGEFDVPMLFGDRVFDARSGLLFFDLFNLDGILGDKFTVNGKIQPFFQVAPRRYRLRWLNSGPSRFLQLFLTDLNHLGAKIPFYQISTDGNLIPKPIPITSMPLSVAERADVMIDFSPFAGKSIYIENRLQQNDGRGPDGSILPAGQGNLCLRFDVVLPAVADNSADPATITKFYDLPDTAAAPVVTRTFRFDRGNGQWTINGKLFDNKPRFRVKRNTVEHWIFQNDSGGWQHPIHVHFEEFEILSRNGRRPPLQEVGRKDVVRLGHGDVIKVFFNFRDFVGRFPMHCHNVVHEDHAMMLRFDIDDAGDRIATP